MEFTTSHRVICIALVALCCLAYIGFDFELAYNPFKRAPVSKFVNGSKPGAEPLAGKGGNLSQLVTTSTPTNYTTGPHRRPPLIMIWNTLWHQKHWYMGLKKKGKTRLKGCRVDCEVTTDRQFYMQSSAVLVWGLERFDPFPPTRPPWQPAVMFILEPPNIFPLRKQTGGKNLFNWTMSYRRDSDVVVYHSEFLVKRERRDDSFNTSRNYAKEKSKLVVWLVSNCRFTTSNRTEFAMNLQKHIKVDILGKCRGKENPCGTDKQCSAKARKYKFYLAFENSVCKQYAQKIWKTDWDSVPVVLGGENYSSILPPHSYIDVADFASPEALARYLRKVASNDTLYNSYFEYKQYYRPKSIGPSIKIIPGCVCRLCEELARNETFPSKTYADVYSWWTEGTCWSPEEQYPHLKRFFKAPADTWTTTISPRAKGITSA